VMSSYARVLERLDELLDQEGILPGLTHVPLRYRPTPLGTVQSDDGDVRSLEPADADADPLDASRDRMTDPGAPVPDNAGAGQAPTRGPHTAWMGQHSAPISNDEQASLDKLMELLSGRRG